MQQPLGAFQPGQKGTVVAIQAEGSLGRRMLDMGITPGAGFEIERVAPLGDPIDVKIRGYHLSLRREEAARILAERV